MVYTSRRAASKPPMKAICATLYLACAPPVLSFTGGLCGNAQLASHHWVLRGHLAPAAKADRVKTDPRTKPHIKSNLESHTADRYRIAIRPSSLSCLSCIRGLQKLADSEGRCGPCGHWGMFMRSPTSLAVGGQKRTSKEMNNRRKNLRSESPVLKIWQLHREAAHKNSCELLSCSRTCIKDLIVPRAAAQKKRMRSSGPDEERRALSV
jgi:hypothetical protein